MRLGAFPATVPLNVLLGHIQAVAVFSMRQLATGVFLRQQVSFGFAQAYFAYDCLVFTRPGVHALSRNFQAPFCSEYLRVELVKLQQLTRRAAPTQGLNVSAYSTGDSEAAARFPSERVKLTELGLNFRAC